MASRIELCRISKQFIAALFAALAVAAVIALPWQAFAGEQERQTYTTETGGSRAGAQEEPALLGSQSSGKAVQAKDSGKLVPVYRFFDTKSGFHHWTTDVREKNTLAQNYNRGKNWWKYEGIAFYVPQKSSKPVYRFWNTKTGDHLWTTDTREKNVLQTQYKKKRGSWRYEGIAFYSSESKKVPVYRFFHTREGQHHWTADRNENNVLVKKYRQRKSYYKPEGVSYYVASLAKNSIGQGSFVLKTGAGRTSKGGRIPVATWPANTIAAQIDGVFTIRNATACRVYVDGAPSYSFRAECIYFPITIKGRALNPGVHMVEVANGDGSIYKKAYFRVVRSR